jgi:UDP-N-acetylglucosamine 2-epimerase (non-hydrolysing)
VPVEHATWHVLHAVGARPNFVKMAPIIDALAAHPDVRQTVVHTGQHYDERMSAEVMNELGFPRPDVFLGIGSGTHGEQTGRALIEVEQVLLERRPDMVCVGGDVNSTLAVALAASKLMIPVAHVEAGLRSFDWRMPEEINRVLTDRLSDLLFTHSPEAAANLAAEGIDRARIHFVGNTMIDSLRRFEPEARRRRPWERADVVEGEYVLATLHRPSNVDDDAQLRRIVAALVDLSERAPVVFPIHPRTRARLVAADLLGILDSAAVRCETPMPYLDFVGLEAGAAAIVTDSGGVQEESTALGVPCYTLRPNTERPITVAQGTNTLLGEDPAAIRDIPLTGAMKSRGGIAGWDAHASERVAEVIIRTLGAPGRKGGGRFVRMKYPMPDERVELFGCAVDALEMPAAVARCEQAIETRAPIQHMAINAAKVVAMQKNERLLDIVKHCELVTADGQSVVWASRVLGSPLPARVTGIDLMHELVALAERKQYRVYVLGAEREVLDRALVRLRQQHPRLMIVGHHDGYFSNDEEPAVVAEIRASRADMLFVAMPSPRKEYFLSRWGDRLEIPVTMGVGGAIDVVAGVRRRAPVVLQRLGLEWWFRLAQEPKRLFRRYLVTNTRFISMVVADRVRRNSAGDPANRTKTRTSHT